MKRNILILGIAFLMAVIYVKREHIWKVIIPTGDMVSDFEDKRIWDISPEKAFALKNSTEHVTEGEFSLQATFPRGGLPSINTKDIIKRWGEYEYLSLDVFNPHDESINFKIRLDDDRFKRITVSKRLDPGANNIKIKYSKLKKKIDPSNISFIVLHLTEPPSSYTLYFDNLHLVRQKVTEKAEVVDQDEKKVISGEDISSKLTSYENSSFKMEKVSIDNENFDLIKAAPLPKPQVVRKGELKAAVAKIKVVDGKPPLVSTGIPFAPGQLASDQDFSIFDMDGNELPIATRILAKWPQDNSIRSVLVQFDYPIEKKFSYIIFKWGVKRTTKKVEIIEPRWQFPEASIIMPAQWLCDSQVVGEQVPVGYIGAQEYNKNIFRNFDKLATAPKTGNLRVDDYYSTPHIFYQLFVRTGELKYFLAARRELIYYRENNIKHEGQNRGKSTTGNEPRYVYVQALVDDYLLTGDPRSYYIASLMVEYLKNNFPPSKSFYPKDSERFWTERISAFPFLGIVTWYELTGDERYLELSQKYMENLHKTQRQWPTRGGFIHNLYAHDPEEGARRDEYGGSPFMTGLLLEPIIKYHRLTGSEIAADSIIRAAQWLIDEGLTNNGDSFKYMTADRYASSSGEPDINLLVVHALGYAYRLSGYQNEEFYNVAYDVFKRGVKDAYLKKQKHFNQNYRTSGHYLAYIKDAAAVKFKQAQKGVTKKREPIQKTLKSVFYFEGFNKSQARFRGIGDTKLRVDDSTTYLNGNALRVKAISSNSTLSAGVALDGWSVEYYPTVSFSYLIPKDVPVGLRIKTSFGDWVCLGGTENYNCNSAKTKTPIVLKSDGQWNEISFNLLENLKTVLPGIKEAKEIQFYTEGNAIKDQAYWLDDVKIRK